MIRYVHRTLINAPLARVAAFHQDGTALQKLMPPPIHVDFHTVQAVREGSQVDFTMWFGPFRVRWIAIHTAVDSLRGFTDVQVTGPFKHWVHRHSFESIDDHTTVIQDEIRAEFGSGLLLGLVSRFMWLNLPVLFWHRGRAIRQALRSEAPGPLPKATDPERKQITS